jgi:hypothetical protein
MRPLGIALITGTVLFWLGAFYFPIGRAWTARTVEAHLAVVADHRLGWLFSNGMMAAGGLLSAMALAVLGEHLYRSGNSKSVIAAAGLWVAGSVLWLLVCCFRLTVTAWAGEQLASTAQVPGLFAALHRFNNFVLVVFMMLAYAATALYGLEALRSGALPRAVSWFALVFGALGFILRPAGVLIFEPPLMVELVPLVMGITLVGRGG